MYAAEEEKFKNSIIYMKRRWSNAGHPGDCDPGDKDGGDLLIDDDPLEL